MRDALKHAEYFCALRISLGETDRVFQQPGDLMGEKGSLESNFPLTGHQGQGAAS